MSKETVTEFSRIIKFKHALSPFIYVTCPTEDKSSTPQGAWVNANQSLADLTSAVKQIATQNFSSPNEVFEITACKDFSVISLKMLRDLQAVHSFGAFLAEHGLLGAAVYGYFMAMDPQVSDPLYGIDRMLERASAVLENHYYGVFESKADFVKRQRAKIEEGEVVEICKYCALTNDSTFAEHYLAIPLDGAVYVLDPTSEWEARKRRG